MNIRQTFLQLTQFTYPYGYEDNLLHFLPKNIQKDEFGNYFLRIGDSKTMFTCHLDTCSPKFEKVNHYIGSQFIETDGKTILGADDKAGMTILLYMIEKNVPGLYYFFIGEEVGAIGSSAASALDFSNYNKCVSFDRRGYNSVITHQFYGACCSNIFAKSLSDELNKKNLLFSFSPDPTGIFTDSASFMDEIPECTNISVGYFNEHQVIEKQDILFLINLCEAVVKVDWESLPIHRDPKFHETTTYSQSSDYGYAYKSEIEYPVESAILTVWIGDEKWKAKLTNTRLIEERSYICDWAFRQGCYNDFRGVGWDGATCHIEYDGRIEYLGEREDLTYWINELEEIPVHDLELKTRLN